MNAMKRIFVIAVLLLGWYACRAQDAADSVRFRNPSNWKTVRSGDGISVRKFRTKCRKAETYLFSVPQAVYVMEVDPSVCRIVPVQDEKQRTVGSLVRSRDALAGVNGGFFVVHPEPKGTAVANDFLKIGGRVVSPVPTPGWGDAAVGFDRNGIPHFTSWNKAMDTDTLAGWSAEFPDVMVAGPMIIRDGRSLHEWADTDKCSLAEQQKRNLYAPRTAIGIRGDSTVVLVVIDGRRPRAFGASFSEMAAVGRWLGLTQMLNLDGGGSSTMISGRRLVNFPSDGFGILPIERRVANAWLVLPR
ncbi:Exopolysaccharide biosynthesis protein related to N-acetylglucosamine-1-phosphodiester alpha-N-acetylglucosaminidase [Rikenella microfusus]|uniref:Exopolysaccharide biosynthesis protein related to N-acetylglucosamine-1-phosphodiester alpha-N-acetylglucosaminidase n=2 Tax=Rikenella microfusus TaxID=28139 RepID=A0A379MPB8_9BACT|nr:Exopolysaccharide biosynthesis protein related to N-acetylglucosamine-1-phosphodiester alpha-N-acetylglucosaminidase [Rikenella microfusus]